MPYWKLDWLFAYELDVFAEVKVAERETFGVGDVFGFDTGVDVGLLGRHFGEAIAFCGRASLGVRLAINFKVEL